MSDPFKLYEECLEAALKEFQKYNIKIPSKQLSEYNDELVKSLKLDADDGKVQATFHATEEINEKYTASESQKLTFSKKTCYFKQGRWNFYTRYGSSLKDICILNLVTYMSSV